MPNQLLVYHSSDNPNIDFFDLSKDRGMNLFGRGIYFFNISECLGQFGKYTYKCLIKPLKTLNFNKNITGRRAQSLFTEYKKFTKIKTDFDFSEEYETLQIGEFFETIEENEFDDNYYDNIRLFIISLGFDSFKFYSNCSTNYILKPSFEKYLTFVMLNPTNTNIKIVDRF